MTHFLKSAALLLCLVLAGCASTTGAPDSGQDTYTLATASAAPGVRHDNNPPGLRNPVYPSGGLRALPSLTLSALPVHALTPPADMWDRIRLGFAMPDLDNDLVRDREQWYVARPDYVQRMTDRGGKYLFYIVEELERRGMPTELALLPFIESAFNPQAVSSARAAGMWQFMPATGKYFELKQNMFRDERRDVLASTRAALDYLQRLYGMFGDWHLALAAYNWGEGNVKRAIARNERAGLPTDYESLSMPAETRHYVPKFQAVKNIVLAPQNFGLALPKLENHPYFLSVPIRRDIDVAVAARLAGLPLEEFKALNPQMNKPVILAAGTPQILLPYNSADTFVKRLASHQGPLASWTAWVAPKTMKTAQAAELVGMSEAELREINRIPPKMLVKAGSTLLVQRAETRAADVPEHVADNAHMALAPDVPPLRKVAIRARKGDTVAALAKRYRVSANQIAAWNRIDDGTRFRKAQALVIWVPTGSKIAPVAEGRALAKAKAGKPVRMAAASPNRGGAAKGMKIRPTRVARK